MKAYKTTKLTPIWGDVIPGNTGEDKKNLMEVDTTMSQEEMFRRPGVWDRSDAPLEDMSGNATMVWREEVENGHAKETMDDVPFLAEHLVEGSEQAVIICPGGAFLTKSMVDEGEEIAKVLNEAGISAFVLWYRSYPYYIPYQFLDLQRAVRFVRFHAKEYGIDPNKISTVGFSAGGTLNGVQAFIYRNKPVEVEGYTPDEIYKVDANVNAVALIYPGITLAQDKALACLIGKDAYNIKENRKKYADMLDIRLNVKEGDAPVFLCGAYDDQVLPNSVTVEFGNLCHEKKIPCEIHAFPFGGHGFGACNGNPNPFGPSDFRAVKMWLPLYTNWLKNVYDLPDEPPMFM